MTLNYWLVMKRYPKPNGVVGGSIPGYEIFYLLDGKTSQIATYLLCSKKKNHVLCSHIWMYLYEMTCNENFTWQWSDKSCQCSQIWNKFYIYCPCIRISTSKPLDKNSSLWKCNLITIFLIVFNFCVDYMILKT